MSNLSFHDVFWGKSGKLTLRIKGSKTDPFRVGCHIELVRLDHVLCPVTALGDYLAVRGSQVGPLFVFSDGTFLTRNGLSDIIKSCFPNQNFNTHSFRIGGASAAAQAGVSILVIKELGRWKSDSFLRYIHFPEKELKLAKSMNIS